MSRQVTLIDIFVSSPDDVKTERFLVSKFVQEWNRLRSTASGFFFNALLWEDVVAPDLNDDAQGVIGEQVGNEYDIYLGMMWGSYGSAMSTSESGTAKEFEQALVRFRREGSVRVAMLFKTSDIPTAQLNGAQFDKVKAFKKHIADEGGFYGEFDSEDRLRGHVNRLLEDVVKKRASLQQTRTSSAATVGASVTGNLSHDGAADVADPDGDDDSSELGVIEIGENLEQVVSEQVKFFSDLSLVHTQSREIMGAATEKMKELARFGTPDREDLKPLIAEVSAAMDMNVKFLDDRLDYFKEKDDELIALTEASIDVSSDFGVERDDHIELVGSIASATNMLNELQTSVSDMIEQVRGLPRMTTEFNRSKKRLLSRNQSLNQELIRLHQRMAAVREKFGSTGVEGI